jgi:hypothetical protein
MLHEDTCLALIAQRTGGCVAADVHSRNCPVVATLEAARAAAVFVALSEALAAGAAPVVKGSHGLHKKWS